MPRYQRIAQSGPSAYDQARQELERAAGTAGGDPRRARLLAAAAALAGLADMDGTRDAKDRQAAKGDILDALLAVAAGLPAVPDDEPKTGNTFAVGDHVSVLIAADGSIADTRGSVRAVYTKILALRHLQADGAPREEALLLVPGEGQTRWVPLADLIHTFQYEEG